MNKEIKFRAKHFDSGKWVYGQMIEADEFCIIDQQNELYIDKEYNFRGDTHFFRLSGAMCDKSTVCQYTGMKDKTGKEIYEGDILGAFDKTIGYVEGGVRGYCYDVVYIKHQTGEKRWPLFDTVKNDYPGRIEVIGNIYDNPELIKE